MDLLSFEFFFFGMFSRKVLLRIRSSRPKFSPVHAHRHHNYDGVAPSPHTPLRTVDELRDIAPPLPNCGVAVAVAGAVAGAGINFQ